MGCNAWNHDPNCPCDFRGGHGYRGGGGRGRGRGGSRGFHAVAVEPGPLRMVARPRRRDRRELRQSQRTLPGMSQASHLLSLRTTAASSSTRHSVRPGPSTGAPTAVASATSVVAGARNMNPYLCARRTLPGKRPCASSDPRVCRNSRTKRLREHLPSAPPTH
jgi:hypothetical protein